MSKGTWGLGMAEAGEGTEVTYPGLAAWIFQGQLPRVKVDSRRPIVLKSHVCGNPI